MDIATEKFSHLEIVGATIQMLLTGINGDLKNAAYESDLTKMLDGKAAKGNYVHDVITNPHFFVVSCKGNRTHRKIRFAATNGPYKHNTFLSFDHPILSGFLVFYHPAGWQLLK